MLSLQRLCVLSRSMVAGHAKSRAARLKGEATARTTKGYRCLFSRAPSKPEIELGLQYLHQGKDSWPQYAQVLLSSNEFGFVQ